MSPWPFVAAAYALGIGGTLALVVTSYAGMRVAERRAEALKRR